MKINKYLFCPRDKKVASISHYTIWGQGLRQSVVKMGSLCPHRQEVDQPS